MIKLSKLKPNPDNPRIMKDSRFKKLLQSIDEFPKMMYLRPIIRNENWIVIAGNYRLKALKELGYKEIPAEWVKPASELTEEEIKRFILIDNENFGENDWGKLKLDWDMKQLDMWGVQMPSLKFNPPGEDDQFEVPDSVKTDIVLGDLIEIGDHRLVCGSSTDSHAVWKLFDGKKPNIMITDPPYGVNLDQTWRDGLSNNYNGNKNLVDNDDRCDWTEAYKLFPGNVAYIWHANWYTDVVMQNLRACNFEPKQTLIMNKSVMVMGRSDYHWKHEPCWYAIRKGANHSWVGGRKQTTIIDVVMPSSRAQKSTEDRTDHPTQKPVLCHSIPLGNHKGDCYDPFGGSGTTMVAAEQLQRKAYVMELNPVYCQIIIDRMIRLRPGIHIRVNGENYEPRREPSAEAS